MSTIRYFICGLSNCHSMTAFDLKEVKKPNKNIITCSNCGKQWVATITSSCCGLNIKFVSIERGSKKPIVFIKSFPKG